jgi:hypothetical protein
MMAQLEQDPAARLWRNAAGRLSAKVWPRQGLPGYLAAPQRWTLMSETLRELRRSWHAHRGRQMTLEAIACLIAGFTARSGALAITSCDHTATRFRLTSKSLFDGDRLSYGHRRALAAILPGSKSGHAGRWPYLGGPSRLAH